MLSLVLVLVYLRPRFAMARYKWKQKHADQLRADSVASATCRVNGLGFLRAVSDVVKEGALDNEEEDYDDEPTSAEVRLGESTEFHVRGPINGDMAESDESDATES